MFEQKRSNDGESVLDSISDKLGNVKDKVVDTTKDVANKTKDTIASSFRRTCTALCGDRIYEERRTCKTRQQQVEMTIL